MTDVGGDTSGPQAGRDAMASEARKLAVDVLYSEKGHFLAARSWRAWHYGLGVPAALIGAGAGASILGQAPILVPGLLTLLAAALTALITFLNPSDRAAQHDRAGVEYARLRRTIRQFVQIDFATDSDGELRRNLDSLTERVATVQGDAPPISAGAHRAALASIKAGSADYTSEELDTAAGALDRSQAAS